MGRASIESSRVKRVLTQHDHKCGACAEEFDPNEYIFLIQIVRPYRYYNDQTHQWELHFEKQIDEESGEFENYPYFFHQDCWTENADELAESAAGVTPTLEGDPACTCNFCKSHICEGELMGVVHLGEFVLSERQPNGHDAIETPLDPVNPTYLCVNCLNEFNINIVPELWDVEGSVAVGGEAPWESG